MLNLQYYYRLSTIAQRKAVLMKLPQEVNKVKKPDEYLDYLNKNRYYFTIYRGDAML